MPQTKLGLPLPVTLRPGVALTDEQLMRFSQENKPSKIERNREGGITVMTPVGGIGSKHEAYVAWSLYQWNEEAETGVVFGSNAGFNLADGSCLSPDAAWLRLDRWNALTEAQQAGYPPLCPDFIIEVRSQSDSRRVLEAKMQLWIENGTELAWLIDPIERQTMIFRPAAAVEMLDQPELVQGTGPVAGFDLRTPRLWGPG